MATDLFNTLENKVQALIDEVELLRLEVSELKENKDALETEKAQWEAGISQLLNKLQSATQD